jgi:hypothetical protein
LLAFPDALTLFHRRAIADFALREHLPSIFGGNRTPKRAG